MCRFLLASYHVQMIREEIEDMKLDTEFLRQCIDGEHEYR